MPTAERYRTLLSYKNQLNVDSRSRHRTGIHKNPETTMGAPGDFGEVVPGHECVASAASAPCLVPVCPPKMTMGKMGILSRQEPGLGLVSSRAQHHPPWEPSEVVSPGFDGPTGPAGASQAAGSVGARPGARVALASTSAPPARVACVSSALCVL